jgi:hypothetical protein
MTNSQDIAGLIERLEGAKAYSFGVATDIPIAAEAATALRALVAENERLTGDVERGFQVLASVGVSRDRASVLSDGIMVFDQRMQREVQALRQRLEAAETVLDNVQHGVGCPGLWDKPCICGLDAYRSKQE